MFSSFVEQSSFAVRRNVHLSSSSQPVSAVMLACSAARAQLRRLIENQSLGARKWRRYSSREAREKPAVCRVKSTRTSSKRGQGETKNLPIAKEIRSRLPHCRSECTCWDAQHHKGSGYCSRNAERR
jgi:hypothetical protein